MGLVGFLQFFVKYSVDFLAWPVLALAYPLCASIRAIETNSVLDTQKLNTYWVVFSLILLLEHASCFLDWFLFWPYLRLIIVCSLVIPFFDGAFYVYNRITYSLLSIDTQIIVNWLTKPKEASVWTEKILSDVEKYVSVNGTEALKKIIAKKSGSKKNLDVREIKAVSSIDNEVVNQVSRVESEITQTENITALPTKTREKVYEIQFGRGLLQTPVSKVSREEPKVNQRNNITDLPTETREIALEVLDGRVLPQTPVSENVRCNWTCGICQVTVKRETDYLSHLGSKRHKSVMDKAEKAKNLWCKVCNIKYTGKGNMEAHLRGRRHMGVQM